MESHGALYFRAKKAIKRKPGGLMQLDALVPNKTSLVVLTTIFGPLNAESDI